MGEGCVFAGAKEMILAIYCAGGLGKEVIELARWINRWDAIVFVDDVTDAKMYAGASIHRFEEMKNFHDELEFVIATGEPAGREKLFRKIKDAGYKLTTIVAPGCTMFPGSSLGEGCVIVDATTSISTNVVIGDNVLINGRACIGHDAVIGNNCVMSVYSFVGGGTKIGNNVYVAPGAMLKDKISVGDDAIIGMGAVVLRHVRSAAIMLGNPAKRVGINTEKTVFNMFN